MVNSIRVGAWSRCATTVSNTGKISWAVNPRRGRRREGETLLNLLHSPVIVDDVALIQIFLPAVIDTSFSNSGSRRSANLFWVLKLCKSVTIQCKARYL